MDSNESIRAAREWHSRNSKSMAIALISASLLLGPVSDLSMAFAFSSPGSSRSGSRSSAPMQFSPSKLRQMNLETRRTTTLVKMTSEDKEAIEQTQSSILPTERISNPTTNGDSGISSKTVYTKSISPTEKGGEKSGMLTALILLPSLLFKFTIVLLVKFATDVVVYPFLFAYGLARVGKKKLLRGVRRVFGSDANDSSNSAGLKGPNGSVNGNISATGINGHGVLDNIKVNGDS